MVYKGFIFNKRVVFIFLVLFFILQTYVYFPSSTQHDNLNVRVASSFNKTLKINPAADFKLISSPEQCSATNPPLVLAFVTLSVDRFQTREDIRSTWANKTQFPELRTVFALGLSKKTHINEMVRRESEKYGDIIQADFMESYFNLTLKSLTGIRWAAESCPSAKFVLKIDDDLILNTEFFFFDLKKHYINETGAFYCNVFNNGSKVIRDKENKWYIPREVYAPDKYPMYCNGPSYLITGDLPAKLIETTVNVPIINIEDVYIGLLARELKAKFLIANQYYDYPRINYIFNYYKQSKMNMTFREKWAQVQGKFKNYVKHNTDLVEIF